MIFDVDKSGIYKQEKLKMPLNANIDEIEFMTYD